MFVVNDLFDAILLGSFFFGLIFSGLSLFLGVTHIGIGHHSTGQHPHLGHHGHGGNGAHHGHASDEVMPPISVGTILGFLTWFGGVAYLFRNGLGAHAAVSLLVGAVAGVAGGWAIYWLLKKVHAQQAGLLRAADDYMPGTIARVTSSIRAGGTGEIVYERRGVRHVSAARCPSGEAISRGSQVVVVREAGGVAQVEPWASFVGDGFQELEPGHGGPGEDLPPPHVEPSLSSRSSDPSR